MLHTVAWFLIAFYAHGMNVTPVPTEKACNALVEELVKNGVSSAKCVKVDE
jgi:hypothetical protein